MKEISTHINNAEARFQVLEEQMKQNVKDHETIIEKVEHNCDVAAKNFKEISDKIDTISAAVEKMAWVGWFIKILISAGVVGMVAAIFELITHQY